MTRGNTWTVEEDAILFEERAKGTIFKIIADMIGRPLNGCEQRYSFLRRQRPNYQPRKSVEVAQIQAISKPAAFQIPEKRRCLNTDCRKWFHPTHAGQYFCVGHRPSDDTGMLERSVNYRTPARMSF